MSNVRRRWTEEELKRLEWDWKEERPKKIAEKLNRTEWAVIRKAIELGLGSANKGNESVNAFSARIGYTVPKVRKAIDQLGIKLYRGISSEAGKKSIRTLVVNEDHHETIIEFLANNERLYKDLSSAALRTPAHMWGVGKKPPACLICGRTDRTHASKGRCEVCYESIRKKARRKRKTPSGVWGVGDKPAACLTCSESSKPHHARGLCHPCYNRKKKG
jgi:hypothetical protein